MLDAVEIETRDGLRRFVLEKPRMTIGRLPGNDIVLPYSQISRNHAELRQRGEDWWVIDVGSTNGIHFGGRQVKEYLLHHNDEVLLTPSITLHFISGRPQYPREVEGTLELPAISLKAHPRIPEPEPGTFDPFERSVVDIASAISMPMPRRRLDGHPQPPLTPRQVTPPPVSKHDPQPILNDDALDAWLRDGTPQIPSSFAVTPPPTALPVDTPFARQRTPNLPATPPVKAALYTCHTCGERTAPDSPYCWSCRSTIAMPCRMCKLFLLPVQATCQRCYTPNEHAVKRKH
jgi:hypothetical protein